MNTQLTTTQPHDLTIDAPTRLQVAGQVANRHAAGATFADYLSRKADNTIRTHAAALATFADYLAAAGIPDITAGCLQQDPDCWRGVTWGIVEGFVKWQLSQGYAVATVNNRLSVVKTYAKLASKAGAIPAHELAMIRSVNGYSKKESKRVNERRDVTRTGDKKAKHTSLSSAQAETLKRHDLTTAQGARDALLMYLLLDHGLRCGEVAGLQVTDFKLKAGELVFYREKVDKQQTHELTAGTRRAAIAYFSQWAPAAGRALLGSRKGGALTSQPMSKRAITKRVRYLGKRMLGIDTLSAHDCRHFWATDAARNGTQIDRLMDAGGWASHAMPLRYIEAARIANKGVKLSA